MQEKVFDFIKDFIVGLKAVYQAFFYILNHWLWLYCLIPVLLSLGLLLSGEFLWEDLHHINIQKELNQIDFQKSFNEFSFRSSFEFTTAELFLLLTGFKLILMLLLLKMTKYFVLAFLSPILTLASAQIEKIITGNTYRFEWKRFVEDIYRSILFSFRNMMLQIFFMIVWQVCTFIYVDLKYVTPIFIFLLGAYYYGASLMDYTNERRRLTMEESMNFVKKNKGMTIAIGCIFSALFFIDYIGIVIAPILGVVAATLAIHAKVDLSKNKYAIKGESWADKQKKFSKPKITNDTIKDFVKKNIKEVGKETKDQTNW